MTSPDPSEPGPKLGAGVPEHAGSPGSGPGAHASDEAHAAPPRGEGGTASTGVAVGERAVGGDPVGPGRAENGPTESGPTEHGPTEPGATEPGTGGPHRSGQGSFLRELPVLVLIAVVLALLIKTFLVQAFFIPSGSMLQTLQINDRVLVNKVVYHLRNPHRGEIVVFDTKGTGFEGQGGDFAPCPPANPVVSSLRAVQRFLGVGACGDTDFIKRVVAVPGDTVQCCDASNRVLVNGRALNENYVFSDNHEAFCAAPPGSLRPAALGDQCATGARPVTLPAGMYWVMGDHRSDSSDSRPNGFVPGGKIVGRAFIRVWPVGRIGVLHVPGTFQHVQALGLAVGATPMLSAPVLLVPLAGALRWRRGRERQRRQR